jgi:purine-binding chemotaxis protein CheW
MANKNFLQEGARMQEHKIAESYGAENDREGMYLTFSIGDDVFGIGIEYVREIIGIQPIMQIPEFPDHIKGVINLRGKIIPIMDVRLRFKRPERPYDARTCIIVVDVKGVSIGLIVDRVVEVITIPDREIAAPPGINRQAGRYIKGFGKVGDTIKLLLDCDVLLGEEAKAIQEKEENIYEVVRQCENLI